MATPVSDWKLAYWTAKAVRRRIPAITAADSEALAAEVFKSAATARAAAAGWMGVSVPLEEDCLVVASDFDGMLCRRLETVPAVTAGGGAVSKMVSSLVLGAMLGVSLTRVNASYDDHDPDALWFNVPLFARDAGELARFGLTVSDFIMKVCLHEETHRLQFLTASWLREYRTGLDQEMTAARAERDLPRLRSGRDRIWACAALIEGHACVVETTAMPELPLQRLREYQGRPRRSERVRLFWLGLNKKTQMYRQGRDFVEAAVERVGWDGFSAVWKGPENLPTREEILTPQAWCERLHG